MTILWYSIRASIENVGGGNTIVNYYFSVDTSSNLITGFYNFNNIGVNILFPVPPPLPYFTSSNANNPPFLSTADNVFDSVTYFSDNCGMNFSDTYLQSKPIQFVVTQNTPLILNYPLFSFYGYDFGSGFKPYLWAYSGPNGDATVLTNSINIMRIPDPSLQIICFKEDSKILTDKGYIPIQDLRKGDLVKTLKK